MFTDLERAVDDRSEPHALQPHHRVAHRIAHVADLTRPPLVQRDRHQRLVLACAEARVDETDHGGRRAASLDGHAAAQPLEGIVAGHAAHPGVVLAFHLVARVQQAGREVAVVGEQQQALRVVVEAAHRVDVLAHVGQQVEDGWPLLGVLPRRHVAARLVEQDVPVARGDADTLTVHADVVVCGVGPRAEFPDRRAVDRHAAVQDERLGGAPRGDAGGGEDLLQAVAGGWLSGHTWSFRSKEQEARSKKQEARSKKQEGNPLRNCPNPQSPIPNPEPASSHPGSP